jgi:phosphate transport system protein
MRDIYQQQLVDIIDELVDMTAAVRDLLRDATRALIDADIATAEAVISADQRVDAMRERVEEESFEVLALQAPVAGDLRTLVASLRMVSDLERMGDLAVHIAKVARLRYPTKAVPAEVEPTITSMAATADRMIGDAAKVIANRDVSAAESLEHADDAMDGYQRSLFRTLLDDSWSAGVEPAIDLALLGRYYERIADHAVSMGRRVVYLVTGEHPSSV